GGGRPPSFAHEVSTAPVRHFRGVDEPEQRLGALLRTAGEAPGDGHAQGHEGAVVAVEAGRDKAWVKAVGRYACALEALRQLQREQDVRQLGLTVASEPNGTVAALATHVVERELGTLVSA